MAARPETSAPDPRAYTPKHLADKILASKSALEGERKQVTVLFADVKGSMDLAEQVDPEAWHRIMDRFFAILAEGVHRFEGTVTQFTGDGIMALFGAPIAHEDHAQRACYVALHLQHELRRYADEVRLEHGLGFSVRMGLNSGEVVVGKIGDDLRMDYTALGHTVGLAQRMEQMADPGKALLTGHTAKLVSGYVQLRDLGATRIKGLADLLHVFELEGVGRMRTRLDVSHARGFSKFVGRQSEMAALEAALEQATVGNAQIVGVVADAGTGKSRLCYEFTERCRAHDVAVYEAHGIPHGKAIPLLPVLEFWRGYFGITEHDTARATRDKIAGRMLLLDETLAKGLPLMFDFLGVPDPERPAPPLGPEARQRQLFDLIRRLARARSAREPAVFLFEDLHWFDRSSEEFIENVVEITPGNRTLVLLNFRPEYHAAWMQRSYYHQLPLLPLGPEATAALLADLLGSDPSLDHLRELIQARTGGNPFFVEEIVQSLVETGAVTGSRGTYRLVMATGQLGLPPTVQNVLAARIDRLAEREKQVLQTASVIGRSFAEPVLRRVAEIRDDDLAAALRTLIGAEFLYEEALYPEAEYAFKHPLTQEVAYRSQLAERRARVHAAVARTIEELDAQKLDERAALLAYHWERAGDPREAAKWHRRAAEWVGLNNADEGLRHWTSARDLLDALPETPESLAERSAVRAQILNLLGRLGDPDGQGQVLFTQGRALAARSGDRQVQSLLLNSFGVVRLYSDAAAEALGLFIDATRLADETGDPGLRVAVRYGLAFADLITGRLRECLSSADEGLRIAPTDLGLGAGLLGVSPYLMLSWTRAFALVWTGCPREAEKEFDRVIEHSRKVQQLVPLYTSHICHVLRCDLVGDPRSALAHGREAMGCVERGAAAVMRCWAYCTWGVANVWNGEWQVARDALDHALGIARERRLRVIEGLALATMARVHLGLGNFARARGIAEEALGLCRELGTKAWEIHAQLARIRALREAGGAGARSEIEAALTEAADWIETTGGTSFAPFLHVEGAELARLTGDEATRQRELREAHRLFTAMGAPIRAEQVATQLGP